MLHDIFSQFGTKEFFSNLAAEFTGLLLEILILSILVPFAIHIYNHIKYKDIRLLLKIDTLRLYDKLTSAIVDFVLESDKYDELTKLTCEDDFKYVSNHEYYGQLDNNLILINHKITPVEISRSIKTAPPEKLNEYAKIFEECSTGFDRLISLLSFFPKEQSKLYKLRENFIVAEKIFATYYKKKTGVVNADPFISYEKSGNVIHSLGIQIGHISEKDRRCVNNRLRRTEFRNFAKQLFCIVINKFFTRKNRKSCHTKT